MFPGLARSALTRATHRLLQFGDESLTDEVTVSDGPTLLYIHVPYCEHLCPYCSFHRVRYQESLAITYFKALQKEISAYAEAGFRFTEIYVGGGTPTVNLAALEDTLSLTRASFDIEAISVETNPDHLTEANCRRLRSAGVDRLSVGVQTFDDQLLHNMGRLEFYGNGESIRQRIHAVKDIFPTLNIDMIFNLPGQTEDLLLRDLAAFHESGANQVSCYPLMVSDSVRERVTREMGRFSRAREESMYYLILDTLSESLRPSSVWCFGANEGQIDEYLVDHDEFIGVGSGAFSYTGGRLYATSFSILGYDQIMLESRTGVTRSRSLTPREKRYYRALMMLFSTRASTEAVEQAGLTLLFQVLRLAGIVKIDGNQYTLTRRGYYYSVVAMSEFLNGVNNLRDEMRAHIPEEVKGSYGDVQPIKVQGE